MPSQEIVLDDLPLLIRAAFDEARAAGKPEWRRMTTAVLKNRLLQLTDRRFDERALGFMQLPSLLEHFSDLVELDYTTRPVTVVLKQDVSLPATTTDSQRTRIRSDLWDATFDFSSGKRWVWDEGQGEARPADLSEDFPSLPTLTKEDLEDLRRTFISETLDRIPLPERDKERARSWAEEGLRTPFLPGPLRGEWNAFLKKLASERLNEWFEAHDISPPGDLLRLVPTAIPRLADEELVRLKEFVIACVRGMTLAEIADLDLPVSAVFRARSEQRGKNDRR